MKLISLKAQTPYPFHEKGGRYRRVCGVYCIVNTVTEKRYIGASLNISQRWGNHTTKAPMSMNKDLLIHGKEAFNFVILEECEPSILREKEEMWIEHYQACRIGYNTRPNSTSGCPTYPRHPMSDDDRIKFKEMFAGHQPRVSEPLSPVAILALSQIASALQGHQPQDRAVPRAEAAAIMGLAESSVKRHLPCLTPGHYSALDIQEWLRLRRSNAHERRTKRSAP